MLEIGNGAAANPPLLHHSGASGCEESWVLSAELLLLTHTDGVKVKELMLYEMSQYNFSSCRPDQALPSTLTVAQNP
jgi:hypothetical protein